MFFYSNELQLAVAPNWETTKQARKSMHDDKKFRMVANCKHRRPAHPTEFGGLACYS